MKFHNSSVIQFVAVEICKTVSVLLCLLDVQMSETDLAPTKEDHQVTFFRTLMVCLQGMLR